MTSPSEDAGEALATPRRAAIVGTGLIGGSIGLALRERGWHVTGRDLDRERALRAVELGALDRVGEDAGAEITFVCTPVSAVAAEARAALAGGGVVTDVGSVKTPVVSAVDHPRFVGGHPMAGSEQEGVDGAEARLFEAATWVLTPSGHTDGTALATVRSVVSSLGADVVALPPERHDDLVAQVSHVPHLTAAALMTLASEGAREHAALLRLAAGGFRDLTRVAAGHPGIWPDLCVENREAIVTGLDRLVAAVSGLRELVAAGDRGGLLAALEHARAARTRLAATMAPGALVEIRLLVPDRPGVLSRITTALGEADVNIADLEIAHSAEGDRGVLMMVVPAASAGRATSILSDLGYRPMSGPLT